MLAAWMVVAPFTTHVSRHKWLASACAAPDAWLSAHKLTAIGVAGFTLLAVLLAVVETGGASRSHQLHMARTPSPPKQKNVLNKEVAKLKTCHSKRMR
jgi:hypothetical protein